MDGEESEKPHDKLPPAWKGHHKPPTHDDRYHGNTRQWQHPQKERNTAMQPDHQP